MLDFHSPDLLFGLHHVENVPEVDTRQQQHRGILRCGGQGVSAVVGRQHHLVRDSTHGDGDKETLDYH